MVAPGEGLRRLQSAAETGGLATLCRRHGIVLVTVFGSVARGEPDPQDLDVAVLAQRGTDVGLFALITELIDLTGLEGLDVVNLGGAGPLLRERALVGAVILHEDAPGIWARESTAAVMERLDTDWLRRLNLDLLAG